MQPVQEVSQERDRGRALPRATRVDRAGCGIHSQTSVRQAFLPPSREVGRPLGLEPGCGFQP